jgi:hypothetical protein
VGEGGRATTMTTTMHDMLKREGVVCTTHKVIPYWTPGRASDTLSTTSNSKEDHTTLEQSSKETGVPTFCSATSFFPSPVTITITTE